MNNLSLYMLSAEEALSVTTIIEEKVGEDLINEMFVATVLPFITKANSDLKDAIARSTTKILTQKLSSSDETRDRAFVGFRDYVKAFTNSPDEEKQVAAQTLIETIREIGWSLWSEGYSAQTGLIKSLISELEKPEGKKSIDTLNCADWVENIKVTQVDFEEISRQKNDSKAEKDTPLVSNVKKELTKHINAILSYVETLSDLKGGEYTVLANKLDEAIIGVMSSARARQTRKGNASEEE